MKARQEVANADEGVTDERSSVLSDQLLFVQLQADEVWLLVDGMCSSSSDTLLSSSALSCVDVRSKSRQSFDRQHRGKHKPFGIASVL